MATPETCEAIAPLGQDECTAKKQAPTRVLSQDERTILLRALFAALPVRRIHNHLYLISSDMAAVTDEALHRLRVLADVSLSRELRYRYGRSTLQPKGLRLSVIRAVLEGLELGEPSEYRGPSKVHLRKYLLAPANLKTVEWVQQLGGRVVSA